MHLNKKLSDEPILMLEKRVEITQLQTLTEISALMNIRLYSVRRLSVNIMAEQVWYILRRILGICKQER